MGLFDNVNYECICPNCKGKAEGFQTKDGDRLLDTLEPLTVDNFYTFCNKCHGWIELTRAEGSKYLMVFKVKGEVVDKYTKLVKIDSKYVRRWPRGYLKWVSTEG